MKLAKAPNYAFFYNLPIIIALVMLVICPFLIMLDESEKANQVTGYAFYLLVLGVLVKIVQYFKNGSLKESTRVQELEG